MTNWYEQVTKRIIQLQEIEKEFGREKMGLSLQRELEVLMMEVQDYEDKHNAEVLQELEDREAIANELVDTEEDWNR